MILVNTGSGNGLLPDGTKPLSAPVLTLYQRDLKVHVFQFYAFESTSTSPRRQRVDIETLAGMRPQWKSLYWMSCICSRQWHVKRVPYDKHRQSDSKANNIIHAQYHMHPDYTHTNIHHSHGYWCRGTTIYHMYIDMSILTYDTHSLYTCVWNMMNRASMEMICRHMRAPKLIVHSDLEKFPLKTWYHSAHVPFPKRVLLDRVWIQKNA